MCGIEDRGHVQIGGANQHQVGALSGCERADLLVQTQIACAVHGGKFKQAPCRQRNGVAEALLVRPQQRTNATEEIGIGGRGRAVHGKALLHTGLVEFVELDHATRVLRVVHFDDGRAGHRGACACKEFGLLLRYALRMHELQIGAQHAVFLQHGDDAGACVHGDRQAELADVLALMTHHVDGHGTARIRNWRAHGSAQRNESARLDALALNAFEVVEIHGLRQTQILSPAIRKATAYAQLAHGAQFGVGVLRCAGVVRPVVHRGDAREQTFGDAQTHGAIRIVWREQRSELERDGKVAALRIITAHQTAQRAVPQMPVRVDKAGQGDQVFAADFRDAAGAAQLMAHGDDLAVADVNVAARQLAQLGVHRQHAGVADDELGWQGQIGSLLLCGHEMLWTKCRLATRPWLRSCGSA